MEFLIHDRLSWLRFLGLDLGAVTPDENTIRLFREKLTRVGAIDALFATLANLANLAYDIDRLIFHQRRTATG